MHISQICEQRVKSVGDHLQVGDEVNVKVMEIDRQGRVRLSIKEALAPVEPASSEQPAEATNSVSNPEA